MSGKAVDRDLEKRLAEIRDSSGGTVRVDQIGEVVQSLLDSLSGDVTAADLRVYQELEGLAAYIRAAKAEIAQLRPQEIKEHFISSASDELDAIVEATEGATNDILDAVEAIESVAAEAPPEINQKLTELTTRLYEACNFQDITGQRITKVVRALKHIEDKIESLVKALGGEAHEPSAASDGNPPAFFTHGGEGEQELLNGPQVSGKANKQDDIDALFSSFD
ncbi:MAG: protein phosphatase CheZ [Alphaproteobacteria bacterium]|nr:protein phosphatase CheZ [Alphaproteobacteria bacterium]